MSYTFNPHSNEGYLSQYKKHLLDQKSIEQINKSLRVKGKSNNEGFSSLLSLDSDDTYKETVSNKTGKEDKEIIESVEAIRTALEDGFADLNDNLYVLQDGIKSLSSMVGQGFSLVVEAQKFIQQYLEQIQHLLRILPDDQKQKAYYIEKGMMYLQNAFKESAESDFYTEALEEFKKAEAIEKKDPFSLYLIGLIHLSSIRNLDPATAELYFRNAARYYRAEVSIDKTNYSYSLLKSKKEFFSEITKVLLFAAKACYIQQKFSQAAELAAEAWKTFPENTKAGFFQSKYLAANQQSKEAAIILEKVIEQDPNFSMDVFTDMDLILKAEISNLLAKLKTEAVAGAKAKFGFCVEMALSNSIATSQLAVIGKLIESETFLDARKALDMLSEPQKWIIEEGAIINEHKEVEPRITSLKFTGSLLEFVTFERESILAIPKAKILIEIEKKEEELALLEGVIHEKQLLINDNKAVLMKQWKHWLVSFCIVGITILVEMVMRNTTSLFGKLILLFCSIVIYGGGSGLALVTIYLVSRSMYNRIGNSFSIQELKKNKKKQAELEQTITNLKSM